MTTGENELVATREFDVPRELVFRAWTTPDLLARWWGPKGFTHTFHECDMRPGGMWKFAMHGPDGVDYPNHNVFVEFVQPERVVTGRIGLSYIGFWGQKPLHNRSGFFFIGGQCRK